jgi:nucleoside-diphosphate-sugar epimerase
MKSLTLNFSMTTTFEDIQEPHQVSVSIGMWVFQRITYPFSTDDSVEHPVSLYAATKKANELMAHTYAHLYGMSSVENGILRFKP